MKYQNSIFYKSLCALYNLNIDKNGETKSVLIDAVYHALLIGKEGLDETKLQMALKTATGSWLDYWGEFYGVYRLFEEEDDLYRFRIIEEITSPKVTIPALKKGATRFLNLYQKENITTSDIKVFEPWTHLIKLDERGTLDGVGRIVDYDYWNYAVVDISLPTLDLISSELISYLNKIKAAGVNLKFTTSPAWDIGIDPNKEEKRYHLWNRINRYLCLKTEIVTSAFKLREHEYPPFDDTEIGSRLNTFGILDGRKVLYSKPVDLTRIDFTTGVIRDHRKSATLSLDTINELLKSYALEKNETDIDDDIKDERFTIYQDEENSKLDGIDRVEGVYTKFGDDDIPLEDLEEPYNSLDELFLLEIESLTGTRKEEGRLTRTLGPVGIVVEKIDMLEGRYVPFSSKNKLYRSKSIYNLFSYKDIEEAFGHDFNILELHNITKTSYKNEINKTKLNRLIKRTLEREHYKNSLQQPIKVTIERE